MKIYDIKAALIQIGEGKTDIFDKYINNCMNNKNAYHSHGTIDAARNKCKVKSQENIIKAICSYKMNISSKLDGSFYFDHTPEGWEYWRKIRSALYKIEQEIERKKTEKRRKAITDMTDAICVVAGDDKEIN
jgi:hypothetical protein